MNTCDYLRFYTDGKWHELNVSDYKLVTLVFHDNLITSSARTISIPVAYLIRESDMVPTTVCPEFIYLPASTATMGAWSMAGKPKHINVLGSDGYTVRVYGIK